jgi:salicylate hydroxylase
MQMLTTVDMSAAKERFGAEPWAIHRVDLHNELLRLATSTTESGIPIKLHLSSEVVSASVEGKILLKDGSTQTADLVVAADGMKSVLREAVTQDPRPAASTGLSAFRLLIGTKQLESDEKLANLLKKVNGGANLLADPKETTKERHMMWYACRKYVISTTPFSRYTELTFLE